MAEPAIKSRSSNVAELTVSELAGAIKGTLEDRFGYVRLRGEISGYRGPHASGHCYFALKDDKAKIEAVIWRGNFQKLKMKPEEGLEVIAQGKITTYPGSSKYQIVIEAMEPAGIGALMALLEERKRKLAAEGLFAEDKKRKLPFLPRVVGIVTSPTGAVIRDMLAGFAERFPTRVLVWPVRVQGETSAAEVAAAIRGFNALPPDGPIPRPDVLIIARGGGSLEDLWGFNEEIVVRAAAASTIPLISAVGHETDWTLIDLAADARAPTPTKAAEWAVPKYSDLINELEKLALRHGIGMRRVVEMRRSELKAAARGLPRPEDLVALPRQKFDTVQTRLSGALRKSTSAHMLKFSRISIRLAPRLCTAIVERASQRLSKASERGRTAFGRVTGHRRSRYERVAGRLSPITAKVRLHQLTERLAMTSARADRALGQFLAVERRRLASQSQMLAALSYQGALKRGFALLRAADGQMVRSTSGVVVGERLQVELADGRIDVTAQSIAVAGPPKPPAVPPPTPAPDAQRKAPTPPKRDNGSQGSLF